MAALAFSFWRSVGCHTTDVCAQTRSNAGCNWQLASRSIPTASVAFTDLPLLVLQTVLWVPSTDLLNDVLQNAKFTLGWHEWNYSASPLWLVVVASGLFMGKRAGGGLFDVALAWLCISDADHGNWSYPATPHRLELVHTIMACRVEGDTVNR